MSGSGRARGLRALLLLAAAVACVLGGHTVKTTARLDHPGAGVGGEVRDTGVAVTQSCRRDGPVGWSGFGYHWVCTAGVTWDGPVPPGYVRAMVPQTFRGSELTPADVGRPVRVVRALHDAGGRSPSAPSTTYHRAQPPAWPGWPFLVLYLLALLAGLVAAVQGAWLGAVAVRRGSGPVRAWLGARGGPSVPVVRRADRGGPYADPVGRWKRAEARAAALPPAGLPGGCGPKALVYRAPVPRGAVYTGVVVAALTAMVGLVGGLRRDDPAGTAADAAIGLALGTAFLLLFLGIAAVSGRQRLVLDGDRIWSHSGVRWRRPVDLRDVVAVRYGLSRGGGYLRLWVPAGDVRHGVAAILMGGLPPRGPSPRRVLRLRLVTVPVGAFPDGALRMLGRALLARTGVTMNETTRRLLTGRR